MAVQGVFFWMQVCVVLQLLFLSEVQPDAPETSRNYYDTLYVEPTATDSQIKKAFRKLAIRYHPDKNKSADAEKSFREITEAYKVLSNKEKRELYDSVGHEAFVNDGVPLDPEEDHGASFHFTFGESFHDFDDSPFGEEQHFHWSFNQDEDGPYDHNSFEEPGFSFHFGDGDENEDEHHY